MRKCVATSAVLVFVLAGCATVDTVPVQYEAGNFPELLDLTTVTVGQVMVSEYDFLSQASATVLSEVAAGFWAGRQGIAAGSTLVAAMSDGQQIYCQSPRRQGAPCLRDSNGDRQFDRAFTLNAFGMIVNSQNIDPVPYRAVNQNIQAGFKYELLYQGIDGRTARLAYREYTDNLARPAFSQDLTYTLEAGDTQIRFRDVVLTIHEATNSEITYTLESGF